MSRHLAESRPSMAARVFRRCLRADGPSRARPAPTPPRPSRCPGSVFRKFLLTPLLSAHVPLRLLPPGRAPPDPIGPRRGAVGQRRGRDPGPRRSLPEARGAGRVAHGRAKEASARAAAEGAGRLPSETTARRRSGKRSPRAGGSLGGSGAGSSVARLRRDLGPAAGRGSKAAAAGHHHRREEGRHAGAAGVPARTPTCAPWAQSPTSSDRSYDKGLAWYR